tara:strand:- start:52 stop:570 length:519 start_codon:yes stop_codon:yes gene_type:complete
MAITITLDKIVLNSHLLEASLWLSHAADSEPLKYEYEETDNLIYVQTSEQGETSAKKVAFLATAQKCSDDIAVVKQRVINPSMRFLEANYQIAEEQRIGYFHSLKNKDVLLLAWGSEVLHDQEAHNSGEYKFIGVGLEGMSYLMRSKNVCITPELEDNNTNPRRRYASVTVE